MTVLALILGAVAVIAGGGLVARRRRAGSETADGRVARVLVPFSGALDETVLRAAIRIARAENAVLVAAYLLVVPLQFSEDSPQRERVAVALPLLEAVELAASRAHVPVDARIEKGRSATHALRRLWEVEHFDRIVAPAGHERNGSGFTAKELSWILEHAPAETVVLRPSPAAAAA
ncbi:MAG TPA: hypothetical protein VF094_07040 [Gaiellaceae bacterium]